MGWKSIISQAPRAIRNENLNPLGVGRRDLHPNDEKIIRDLHSEMLNAETAFLQSHRDLAENAQRIGYLRSSKVLNVTDSTIKKLVKSAFGGTRTALPRFDWQENCQHCARPLNQPDEELQSVGKRVPPRSPGDRRPLTQKDIDILSDKNETLKIAQSNFINKKQDFARFIKSIGATAPTARLFDIDRMVFHSWLSQTLQQDPNSSKTPIMNIDNEGNCRSCKRPVVVGES